MLNQMNINQYMYNVYDEYLERYYINALQYSSNNGLIIRYFKILVDESYNFDSETNIQTDYKNFKYAIYDFVPIIDAQPPVSQAYFDPTMQGTSYNVTMTITIAGIPNPLPGDMLHYYDITGNNEIDTKEIFRVRYVNYIRSINNKFPIYQLDIEYAPISRETLDQIAATNVIKHYYWDNETNQFISSDKYKYFTFLAKNRENYLNKVYEIYDDVKAGYHYCKLNSIFKIIQRKHEFSIKVISPDIDFIDLDLRDFMAKFSFYYKIQNKDPITGEEFPEIDPVLEDKLNSINFENEVSFIDINCETKEEITIFKIDKIIDDENNETIQISNGDLFEYYDNVYKILFCYYMINPEEFWKDSIIVHESDNIVINSDGLFYDINGQVIYYEDYLKSIKYDPGYAISYQNGVQYFSPVNTLGF